MERIWRVVIVVISASLVVPSAGSAHCDSMNGPVVQAARRALAIGDVGPALAWVRPEDESEIRAAFERTLAVRSASPMAAELAELWFFETLVRVHRIGEGEPFVGLRPAGTEVPAGIAAADRALEIRSIEDVRSRLADDLDEALRARFLLVLETADHDPADVEAGRRYVAAYSEFVHFVEALYEALEVQEHRHPEGEPTAVHSH